MAHQNHKCVKNSGDVLIFYDWVSLYMINVIK